ncbi:hypothetical protein [Lacticaseibacillus kribbianus]|uniref:glycoside hydrolase family 38 N-terminal domain-containing protein n=1 Tax=Lacticaseibacillus kribbianus TaxID=2926292 RepID=UPI001CD29920|nr:hypothetical protein [Lacticaseibacillus kribbianus]
MKTLYLINHSHTDIGYTARQEDIAHYHADFIRQALAIIRDRQATAQAEDFVWTCENYWQVENFWKEATADEKAQFTAAVEAGHVDLSLNYLNMTELVDQTVLTRTLARGRRFADQLKRPLRAAMTADINGFAWSYASALLNNGVDELFTCIHGHHGLYPLYQNQLPFWWETPDGQRLLVWNGEHYHFGNELGIMPDASMSYQIHDEYVGDFETSQLTVAHARITRYFDALAQRGYPYDFAPVMISGFASDNAGPNANIVTAIADWNRQYGDEIQVKMIGLNGFFDILRQEDLAAIPVYRGDWNDWWADGVGSTPAATKIYRTAQRQYHLARQLAGGRADDSPLMARAEHALMLYAEHTWGYSSSVSQPWNTLVNELDFRKADYAVRASQATNDLVTELAVRDYGLAYPRANRRKTYRVVNPGDAPVTAPARLLLAGWESVEGHRLTDQWLSRIEVYDLDTGARCDFQLERTARAYEFEIVVSLAPKAVKRFGLRIAAADQHRGGYSYTNFVQGAEGVQDIDYPGKPNEMVLETRDFRVELSQTTGIGRLIDRATGEDLLLQDAAAPLFAGVYEQTPVKSDPCSARRRMGRNRKGKGVQRSFSRLVNIRNLADGPISQSVALDYALTGTQMYTVVLKVYKELPYIQAVVQLQKDNTWAPENLYVALPLLAQSDLYAEKSGALFRPAIDQLPGTNADFFLLDTGYFYQQNDRVLGVCLKDTPLITLGNLDPKPIELCGPKTAARNREQVYAWVMNNFWETNFKVDLSGFYEFEFDIFAGAASSRAAAHQLLRQTAQGVLCVTTDE